MAKPLANRAGFAFSVAMTDTEITFYGHQMFACRSGVIWWPDQSLLCVSDMHLGKSERIARRGGSLLPPYETDDTIARLGDEISRLGPRIVVCLGDSFDDLTALDQITDVNFKRITALIAGREWIWIEGNHDAGPVNIGGTHLKEFNHKGVNFRHIAQAGQTAEISGHYHPKARVKTKHRAITKPAFIQDAARLVMPAFGTYTGGMHIDQTSLMDMLSPPANAILTGQTANVIVQVK